MRARPILLVIFLGFIGMTIFSGVSGKLIKHDIHDSDADIEHTSTLRRNEAVTADQPDEAAEFYLRKRISQGEREIPVERYLQALEHIKRMPRYSTASNTFISTQAEAANFAAPSGILSTWQALGPGNIGGRTRAFVVNPRNPEIMYAAGVSGGVWKSTNSGASWAPLADLLPNLAVCALAMDPTNPGIIYAGTGEGFFNGDALQGVGIFKTTDAGASWVHLTSTFNDNFFYVNDIVVSSVDARRVYAATQSGIWKTTDGGATWIQAVAVQGFSNCYDLAMRTDQATDYLFASFYGLPFAVYRNTDAGGSGVWAPILVDKEIGRTSLAIAPSNQNTIYALASRDGHGGLLAVYRSTDAGSTWAAQVRYTDSKRLNTLLLSNPYSGPCGSRDYSLGWYANVIAVDPVDSNRIWAGGIGIFRSDDGGFNWGFCEGIHPDQHTIVFHPQYDGKNNTVMYVGNDGGLFRTDNARAATGEEPCRGGPVGNIKWVSLNNNYAVTQFYYGLPYPDGKSYFGGAQDNGTVRGTDTGDKNGWETIYGGDGGYVAVDPTNTRVIYFENQNLAIWKSTDGGRNFKAAITGIDDDGLFIRPLVMDPNNAQRLWFGGAYLWRTTNGASVWTKATTHLGYAVSAIAICPTDSNKILAGTTGGSIYRTDTALTATADSAWPFATPREYYYVSSVAYDPADANIAYATYSSFKVLPTESHVYKSTDGGATWAGIDGFGNSSIPDLPVHSIVVDPTNTSRLYIGTDLGVFISLDAGASWAQENTGFANVVTESLAINRAGGILGRRLRLSQPDRT